MVMRRIVRLFKANGFIVGLSLLCTAAAYAATAPDFVTSDAVFWLDASALSETAGTELDSWADVRGGSHPGVTTYTTIKPQVIEIADGPLAGKKAVTFFSVKTKCDMKFAANQTVRTAFFVTDIDQSADAYLLGSSGDYYFARGTGGNSGTAGSYKFKSSVLDGVEYWNDGVKVADPTATLIPTGYQLITWCFNNGTKSAPVIYIGQDRNIAARVGGKRLCEVVAFSRVLSDVERSKVEGYLKAKWWGTMSQETATFAMRVHKFGRPQVHFDASEASSFHYGVAGDATGTLVSQWDDLSGNGRHLVPYQFKTQAIKYATRGVIHNAPVLNLGAISSGIDMKLPARLTTTRAVFMVADVDRHKAAYWLGDASTYHFARNDNNDAGPYGYKASPITTNGSIYRNGQKIKSPTSQYPDAPGGLCVYTFNIKENCNWEYLCRDRNTTGRDGGKRIAELITFDTTFTVKNGEAVTLNITTGLGSGKLLDNAIDEEVTHVFVPGAFTQSVVADIDRRKLKATTFVLKDPTKIFIDKATWGRLRKSGLTVKVLENITVAAITVNPTSPAGYSFDHGELASAMAKAVPDIPVIDVMMA